MDKKRADQLLVEKGLAASRTLAQELIKNQQVYLLINETRQAISKPGQFLDPESVLVVEKGEVDRFVSRAGLKLEKALNKTSISINHSKVLDVGLSTGGFTDCVLNKGAQTVFGIEVGHDQTHPRIANDMRVRVFEGINAKQLSHYQEVTKQFPTEGFDLIVMDVSFISMTLILPEVLPYLNQSGHFLGLVKPQFEVGPEGLGKGGLVKDPKSYVEIETKIRQEMARLSMEVKDYFPSEVEGKDGNQEFFVWACRR